MHLRMVKLLLALFFAATAGSAAPQCTPCIAVRLPNESADDPKNF